MVSFLLKQSVSGGHIDKEGSTTLQPRKVCGRSASREDRRRVGDLLILDLRLLFPDFLLLFPELLANRAQEFPRGSYLPQFPETTYPQKHLQYMLAEGTVYTAEVFAQGPRSSFKSKGN